MKSKFIVAIAILFSSLAVKADQVVTTGAEIIECEIKVIKDNSVVFRKPGESFDREMDRSNIFKIKFNNGTEEIFQTETTSKSAGLGEEISTQAQFKGNDIVESEPDWSSYPPASKSYQIGDWYNENGFEGLVIWTTEDGRHGRLLFPKYLNVKALGRSRKFFTGSKNYSLGLNDHANGNANWQRIKYMIEKDPKYSLEMFPLYEYLNQEAPGWYLPAIRELEYLSQLYDKEVNYNGKKTKWSKILPQIIKNNGGDKLKLTRFQSSTETLYVELIPLLWRTPKSNQQYGILWYEPYLDEKERYREHDMDGSTICVMMHHF